MVVCLFFVLYIFKPAAAEFSNIGGFSCAAARREIRHDEPRRRPPPTWPGRGHFGGAGQGAGEGAGQGAGEGSGFFLLEVLDLFFLKASSFILPL